jgi:3-oxoacyl-[acyl-carrier protein] reductase
MKNSKNIFITGASLGLGKALAKRALQNGNSVAFCSRDDRTMMAARLELDSYRTENQSLFSYSCDVRDLDRLIAIRKDLESNNFLTSVLICNAGVIGPIGSFLEVELDKWISASEINLYGTLNSIRVFLPNMISENWGRVIHISGGGATSPTAGMSSYAASKSASVRFIETLAAEYGNHGITFNSVAPGMIISRLLDEMIEAGSTKIGADLFSKSLQKRSSRKDSTELALKLVDFLISQKGEKITGKLISAEWDNWSEWSKYIGVISKDLYTLRRIVGKDRNFEIGDK